MENHTRDVNGSAAANGPPPHPNNNDSNPWIPLVLSLDGGGVRGLSSLYILRRIMLRIRELEAEAKGEAVPNEDVLSLPLPCHYFDNIVGVSTGGLIAIMLGRLRMDINVCIRQYYIICNRIFRPHNRLLPYSARRFERAIRDVVKEHCGCHQPQQAEACEIHPFRQYDFLEFDELDRNGTNRARINGTCRVAVLTQRRAHGRDEPDNVYMMRTYNHRERDSNTRTYSTLNRGQVNRSTVKIWQACRATTAAPLYFEKILIEGRWHIDGGVGDNNPSNHAWNEARNLSLSKSGVNTVALLLSIGTGMTEPHTKFGGLLALMQYARKAITDTERAHEALSSLAPIVGAHYYRFDVRPIKEIHSGLSKIKLDECKKQERNHGRQVPSLPRDDTYGDTDETRELTRSRQLILQRMDSHNDQDATQACKGGYKPHKYDYTTFQTIKELTDRYCLSPHYPFPRQQGAQNVREEINRCAELLFRFSQRRKRDNPTRWQRFRRHPDPAHEANQFNPPREA